MLASAVALAGCVGTLPDPDPAASPAAKSPSPRPTAPTPSTVKPARAGLDEIAATKRFCDSGPDAAVSRGRALLGAAFVAEADVIPNPSLSVSHDRSFNAERDHETVIGIEVPLGIGGRRWILQDAAAARRAQAELEASHDRVMAALSFRRAHVHASLAQARLLLLQSRRDSYRMLVDKLDRLSGGGENAQLESDRLQVEAALSAAGAAAQERELAAQRAWLDVVLGESVALSDDVNQLVGDPGGFVDDNPEVAALHKAAEASAIEADAARRRAVPDIDVFAGYRVVGGATSPTGHGVSLGLSVPLTFFDHGQGEAARADAEATIASAKAEKRARLTRAAESAARARLAAIAQHAPRITSALALAAKNERGTEKLYLAGEGELADLLQARQARTELELAQLDLAAAKAEARLELIAAHGRFAEPQLAGCNGGTQ